MNCACILLAAGASTRLGKPKQLITVGGESLLRRSARMPLEAGATPTLVVLGSYADTLSGELDGLCVEILINDEWQDGMGRSLSKAMCALIAMPDAPIATLVMVCDQPGVTAETLRALIARHGGHSDRIVASKYSGVLGVPAVFGRAFFLELAQLSGEHGARAVIAKHASQTTYVEFTEGAFDIDTPADELALKSVDSHEL